MNQAETDRGGSEEADGGGPAGLVIRLAEPADLDAVARIEGASYSNPWHPSSFGSLLEREEVRVLVAEEPGMGVVGHAVFWWVMDQAELANLAVAPEYRRRGTGAALLDRVLVEARLLGVASVFLEVRRSNEAAHHLYLTRGFMQIAVRKGYYQNPTEDARVLVRFFPPAPGAPDGVRK
jgi:ribosomal-protein-alanine N-acetyltransferase